jgi:hypothetical protein
MERVPARIAFAGISLVLAIAALALAYHGNVGRQSFKAFYCAGVAVKERASPYRVEPMRSCERRIAPSEMPDGYVEPAPLPGYALVPFALLATLPPKLAAEIFALLLAIAAILSAQCLAALVPAPRFAILLALAPLTLLNVAYGEIPPFALLGMCAAAYFLSKRRWVAAGVAVSIALIEPNVGLPAVLAVFLFAPRSRIPILLSAAFLAVASVAALGVSQNIAYFTKALPLMADAELVASDQYSLSHLLYAAGMSSTLAMLIAKIWFAAMVAVGISLAGILAIRHRQPDLLPLLPPACVLFIGIYLHDIQMLLALPAALVIASRVRGDAFRALAAAGLALLIAVWTQRAARATLLIDAAGVAGGLYAVLASPAKRRIVISSAGALVTVACVLVLQHIQPPLLGTEMVTHDFHSAGSDWAPIAWARYLRSTPALMSPAFLLKIPTWAGLLTILLCAFQMCLTKTSPQDSDGTEDPTPTLSGSRERQLASEPCSGS